MLKYELLHPKINEVLGRAGHYSKVLIADGNYPASPVCLANCNRAQYIVGTATQTATCSATIASRTAPGSKRGSSTKVAPTDTPAFICAVWPVE
jgi:hypothetical protein